MKLLDYIFLLRPMLIIPVWTISLLGARAAQWRERGLSPLELDRFPFAEFTTQDTRIAVMLLCATLLAGGVFVLNQIFDVESDRANKKLFLLPDGHVSIKEAWGVYVICTLGGVVGAFVINWQLGCLFVAGGLLGAQYSLPRFNLRNHPYKAFRNNILAHGIIAFLFGWVIYLNFNLEGLVRSLVYALGVGAVYLNTTLPDLEGDVASGKHTYAAEWGVGKTLKVSFYMTLFGCLLSIMVADYAFTIGSALSLPFFAAAWAQKSVRLSMLATKVSILALSLLAAAYFPIYLAVLLLVIIAARLYYSARFKVAYPVLMEDR